ncbi:MAG: hypothetical protein AB7V39_23790, partial [Nitrospiraceae bacterium]
LLMISVSIGFGIFPGHLYSVVRSGVDPLIARITHVVPVAEQPIETHPAAGGGKADSAPSDSLIKVADR